jgi:hypothetical protein
MKRRLLLVGLVVTCVLAVGTAVGLAMPAPPTTPPTGERAHGQSLLEAVFNAENAGQVGYVSTPNHTQHPVPSNPRSWSPIYVVEYPNGYSFSTDGSGADGPLSCWHTPAENCPTHGNDLAGIAMGCPDSTMLPVPVADNPCNDPTTADAVRAVYDAMGVAGHDHVMDFHGGADWNVAWEPVLVLFTDADYADTHRLLTDTAIADAVSAGKAVEIPLAFATFHCAQVSSAVWDLTTAYTG